MKGVTAVLHTATLHKPHVATHSRQDFVDVNITGTLNLLEEAAAAGVTAFVYTSTTSVFGDALVPPPGEPAPGSPKTSSAVPKNIYGVTKAAAEDLCQLFARNHSLRAIVLRTSRFFPEEDDNRAVREAYTDANIKANEFLYRRVDIEDVVSAHLLAIRPRAIGRFREIHHQRHDAVLAPRRRGIAQRRAARACAVTCPTSRRNMHGAAGRWLPASTGSTSTTGRAPNSAGSRAMISAR